MKIFLVSLLVLLLTACSSSFQTSTQVDDKAYLQLVGNFSGAVLRLDNDDGIDLESMKTFKLKGEKVAKLSVTTGTHQVIVERSGQIIVNRKIYVTNGNTFELRIP
ncbi:MAG: hypothetical protein NWQ54_15900 [Paraglaciecola sp.]|uniref:Lipoprotein n=1 Tax=Alishewanella maricola TaxID=2795740 RepID=A0ABS8C285_9ALTE|nr:hypothetical protein [Alishewanella maricola]MCB5226437.1 hypothetical protein [Alishewanella maricola]MDP5132370.1 hypothetical protein [Paraglaciecola sp.]